MKKAPSPIYSIWLGGICLTLAVLYLFYVFGFNPAKNIGDLGDTGSYLGGLLSPVIGLITIYLLYETLVITTRNNQEISERVTKDRFVSLFGVLYPQISNFNPLDERYKNAIKTLKDGQIERPGVLVANGSCQRSDANTFLTHNLHQSIGPVAAINTLLGSSIENQMPEYQLLIVESLRDNLLFPIAVSLYILKKDDEEKYRIICSIYKKSKIFKRINVNSIQAGNDVLFMQEVKDLIEHVKADE